jgi:hypothetical protein
MRAVAGLQIGGPRRAQATRGERARPSARAGVMVSFALAAMLCAGLPHRWQAPVDPEVSAVVDALLRARAATDYKSSRELLGKDAALSTSDDGSQHPQRRAPAQFLNEWMTSEDDYSIGQIYPSGANSVEWTESGSRRELASFANNLNASMDGNEACWTNVADTASLHVDTRSVRVTAVNGKIVAFTISHSAAAFNTNWIGPLMSVVSFVILVAGALVRRATRHRRPADVPHGHLMLGLQARFVRESTATGERE